MGRLWDSNMRANGVIMGSAFSGREGFEPALTCKLHRRDGPMYCRQSGN